MTSADCLFCRIGAGTIPSSVVYATDRILAFRDISPQAPTHVLVITRDHHEDVGNLAVADPALAGELLAGVEAVARAEGLIPGGYRTIFNTGSDGGQLVPHVHAHVLGGKHLGSLLA